MQKLLYQLDFKYKDVKKNVFVDRHEQPDVVKDYKRFLNIIEELKPYMVKFNKDNMIKDK